MCVLGALAGCTGAIEVDDEPDASGVSDDASSGRDVPGADVPEADASEPGNAVAPPSPSDLMLNVFEDDGGRVSPYPVEQSAPLVLEGGLVLLGQPRGLAVVDAPSLRVLGWHSDFEAPVASLGGRRAVVYGAVPGGGGWAGLLSVDFTDALQPVVLDGLVVDSGWRNGVSHTGADGQTWLWVGQGDDSVVVVVHVGADGVFSEARVAIGAPVRRLAFAGEGRAFAWVAGETVVAPCPEWDDSPCDAAPRELVELDLQSPWSPKRRGGRIVPRYDPRAVVAEGGSLVIIGERLGVEHVQVVRLSDRADLGAVELGRAVGEVRVHELAGDRLAVLPAENWGSPMPLWVLSVPEGERPAVVATHELPPGVEIVAVLNEGERLLGVQQDEALLIDPGASGRGAIVSRIRIKAANRHRRRAWFVDGEGVGSFWSLFVASEVFENQYTGRVETSSLTQLQAVDGALVEVRTLAMPHLVWHVDGLGDGEVGVTTEHTWQVVDTGGGQERGRIALDVDDRAFVAVSGGLWRHRFDGARTPGHTGWFPDHLERVPPGLDPNLAEPIQTVELPELATVLRRSDGIAVLGLDEEGRGTVERWDLQEPTAPVKVGSLVSARLALAVDRQVYARPVIPPSLDPTGRWLVAVDQSERPGRGQVFVVDLEGAAGPSLTEVPLADGDMVTRMLSDGDALYLSIFRNTGGSRGRGLMFLVRLATGGAAGPRLVDEVRVPGEVESMRDGRLVSVLWGVNARSSTVYLSQLARGRVAILDRFEVGEGAASARFGEAGEVVLTVNNRAVFEGTRLIRFTPTGGLTTVMAELRLAGGGWLNRVIGPWLMIFAGSGTHMMPVEATPSGGLEAGPLLRGQVVSAEAVEGGWWAAAGVHGLVFLPAP